MRWLKEQVIAIFWAMLIMVGITGIPIANLLLTVYFGEAK